MLKPLLSIPRTVRRGLIPGLLMLLGVVQVQAAPDTEQFGYCLVCHGTDFGGNKVIGGPNLTGLSGWYLKAQLSAFHDGLRGAAVGMGAVDGDHLGSSMASAARRLPNEDAIDAAVDFVESYALVENDATVDGDTARGAGLYQSCAACHGADGLGNEALAAPALAGQSDWYLVKALGDYRRGARGSGPGLGAAMRSAAMQLPDDQAVYDVVAYMQQSATARPVVASTSKAEESDPMQRKANAAGVLPALALAAASTSVLAHDVTRYPLPGGSTFPIAQAVTVPAGTELTFHSGLLPRPADPDADPGTRAFLGDTYTQTMSVLQQFEASLKAKGMGLGNIIKMNVYLVGDPEMDGKMDFAGFMRAYSQFFGTEEQPHLPARAAIQIAGLARGAFIEIEVIAAR
ncbi:MAG: c-type cytochrome [Pseudomonadota bacterium]